jgi:transcriptional regulator with XRE-family HTH domain
MSTQREEAPVTAPEPDRTAGALERYVGNTIRDLRRANGLTIADIAERAELSRGMLSRIENGQTASSLESLNRIARALGVSLSTLFRYF